MAPIVALDIVGIGLRDLLFPVRLQDAFRPLLARLPSVSWHQQSAAGFARAGASGRAGAAASHRRAPTRGRERRGGVSRGAVGFARDAVASGGPRHESWHGLERMLYRRRRKRIGGLQRWRAVCAPSACAAPRARAGRRDFASVVAPARRGYGRGGTDGARAPSAEPPADRRTSAPAPLESPEFR